MSRGKGGEFDVTASASSRGGRTHRFRTIRSATTTTTTKRGYGGQHEKERAAALPRFLGTRCPGLPGEPCGFLFTRSRDMHWDHDDDDPASRGGRGKRFLCRRCNIRKAARKGNRVQRHRRSARRRSSRVW